MADLARTVLRHLLVKNGARIRRLAGGRSRDLPWMLPREQELVEELLRALNPLRCLEWGAGASTLHFPRLLHPDTSWLAVEHDARWAAAIRARNRRPATCVEHVPPRSGPWPSKRRGATEREFGAYLDFPERDAPFDFILIDGRARVACLQRARRWLDRGGVVVLHDANRSDYRPALAGFDHGELFEDARRTDRRPHGGVWIGSPERPIGGLVDLERQRRVWGFYRGWGRWLRC